MGKPECGQGAPPLPLAAGPSVTMHALPCLQRVQTQPHTSLRASHACSTLVFEIWFGFGSSCRCLLQAPACQRSMRPCLYRVKVRYAWAAGCMHAAAEQLVSLTGGQGSHL